MSVLHLSLSRSLSLSLSRFLQKALKMKTVVWGCPETHSACTTSVHPSIHLPTEVYLLCLWSSALLEREDEPRFTLIFKLSESIWWGCPTLLWLTLLKSWHNWAFILHFSLDMGLYLEMATKSYISIYVGKVPGIQNHVTSQRLPDASWVEAFEMKFYTTAFKHAPLNLKIIRD